MTQDQRPEFAMPLRRLALLVLFLAPLAYVAILTSTLIHEVLGHGVTAVLLGGRFDGFAIRWDGFGLADVSAATPGNDQIILMNGVIANVLVGVASMAGAVRWRRHQPARLAAIMLAITCFGDAFPYLFWNAYLPIGRGDIGRVLMHVQSRWGALSAGALRWTFMISSAVCWMVTTAWLLFQTVRSVTAHFWPGVNIVRRQYIVVVVVVSLLNIAGWWIFDWNQLVHDVGVLPNAASSIAITGIGAVLAWRAPSQVETPATYVAWRHVAMSWGAASVAVLVIGMWLAQGVSWN